MLFRIDILLTIAYNGFMKNDILIAGDLVPCGEVVNFFETGDIEIILGDELYDIWKKAKHVFFNLECPITNSDKKIPKCGPHIKCNRETINGIQMLSPTCVFLANNHIMDYSDEGLMDTIGLLNEKKINWIGVGENINSLEKTFVFKCNGRKIGIYNCCEREFSIALENMPGANPYDEFSIEDDLMGLKKKCDYLIVIYHGGKEYYRYPSPELQKRCHRMVECGADLIVCQHSHCIGCEEKYRGSLIVYGQGNFIFNKQQDEFWNTSLLIGIDLDNGPKYNYVPIVQTKNGTRLASAEERNEIIDNFKKRSEQIKDANFIQNEYKKFADEKLSSYFVALNGGLVLRTIRKFCPRILTRRIFKCKPTLNVIECEAHRELFIQGLKNAIEDEEKSGRR